MPNPPENPYPTCVTNAVRRVLDRFRPDETPKLAENASSLVMELHACGFDDEDELVELATLSGGKALEEMSRNPGRISPDDK